MSHGFDPFDPEQWGDKPDCSAFETALDMRARGALAPGAVSVLEAHLAVCDACRDHAARLGRIDASLVAGAASPDAQRLRGKLDDALKVGRRLVWVAVDVGLAMAGLGSVMLRSIGHVADQKWLLAIPVAIVGTAALTSSLNNRRLRRLLSEPDTVGAYRRWVELNLQGLRRFRWFVLAYSVCAALKLPNELNRLAAGNMRSTWVLVMILIIATVAVFGGIYSWYETRRLKAELAEMH